MNLVLLSLLFTVSGAILYMPSPYFDVDQLDSNEAANLDWLFIRDRRTPAVSPCAFTEGKGCENSGSPSIDQKAIPYKSRFGRFPYYRKN